MRDTTIETLNYEDAVKNSSVEEVQKALVMFRNIRPDTDDFTGMSVEIPAQIVEENDDFPGRVGWALVSSEITGKLKIYLSPKVFKEV